MTEWQQTLKGHFHSFSLDQKENLPNHLPMVLNSLRYLQCPLVTAVSASLPVTHRLTFSLPSLTQHFLLNVKWLCCWWRPVGVRSICQGSVQYPLNRNLKPEKPEAINPNSLDSSEPDQRLIVCFKGWKLTMSKKSVLIVWPPINTFKSCVTYFCFVFSYPK